MENFSLLVFLRGSIGVSLTDGSFNTLKNIISVSSDDGSGCITCFSLGKREDRRMWYVGSTAVSVSLTDHKRQPYFDFIDFDVKIEYNEDLELDYYDLGLELVFQKDGIVKVMLRVFDAELCIDENGEALDQPLLEEMTAEYYYYGKNLSFQFKHPYFPDDYNIYVNLKSDVNE